MSGNIEKKYEVSIGCVECTEWKPYKLGEEIHSDWEYRKIEQWYVYSYKENTKKYTMLNIAYQVGDLNIIEIPFVGTKEECEKWIEEHTKKTWLESYLYKVKSRSLYGGDNFKEGIEAVCKKILEEVNRNKQNIEIDTYMHYYEDVILVDRIVSIIKKLGIEV